MESRKASRFIPTNDMKPRRLSLFWLCLPACLLFVVPFLSLARETPWQSFQLAYGDWNAVGVSLGYGLGSMVLIFVFGVPPALWLARTTSRLRPWIEAVVLAVLLTPPLAMGILLVSAYGPYSTAGDLLQRIGVIINNNAVAFVLAQLYGGMAYFILAARAAFEAVPVADEQAAATLGASRSQIFRLITLPLARRGLAAGMIAAWVRVVGEFGIVMVFAYFPQGLPVKLFVNLQNEGVESVYALLWIMLAVTLPLPLLTLYILKQRVEG
jgi:molybdate/tungstate transport system permease protein